MTAGTKIAPFKYGPRRPRSEAQQRATRKWMQAYPCMYRDWLRQQPRLPPGWNYRGGRLNPPSGSWDEDGRLRERPVRIVEPRREPKGRNKQWDGYGPPPPIVALAMRYKAVRNPKTGGKVVLHGRSWSHGSSIDDDPNWQAIVVWINNLANLRDSDGATVRFGYYKQNGMAVFRFSLPEIAYRFWIRFAAPGA